MFLYAESAISNGIKVIIAGAGGAAHLPGMVASITTLPVIGYDPSHKSGNSDVKASYKIFSTLVRMIHNETRAERKAARRAEKGDSEMASYQFNYDGDNAILKS